MQFGFASLSLIDPFLSYRSHHLVLQFVDQVIFIGVSAELNEQTCFSSNALLIMPLKLWPDQILEYL